MTVMNSRSQGASVIKTGRVEIMHQRRLYRDDNKGMGESLNEVDGLNKPISVGAQYFLQLFNYSEEASLQRQIQLQQDEPAQYFYQFNGVASQTQSPATHGLATPLKNLNSVLTNANSNDYVKVSLFPIKKNVISLRIENIGDLFDAAVDTPLQVDIHSLAEQLFIGVNGDSSALAYISIEETTLTGN
jgi:hypothetical protein